MPAWLVAIFEILQFTIPALIMFWAVQSLFKQFLQGQQQMRLMEIKQQQSGTTLPLRLQAYERLSLFCERICLLYTSPSPRDRTRSRMPSSA